MMMTLLELLNSIDMDFYWRREHDYGMYVPLAFRGLYVPVGRCISIWDDCGNRIEQYRAYKPVNGGTVVYFKYF